MSRLPREQHDQLPALRQGDQWPDQFVITRAAKLLDRIVAVMSGMERALARLRGVPTADEVMRAKYAGEHYEKAFRDTVVSGKADKLFDQCEPMSWSDDDGRPLKSEIGKMLAIYVGSIPMPPNVDVPVFTRMLLEDVMALSPRFYALEAACRELRTTREWQPSIAKVLAAIHVQDEAWRRRSDALEFVENVYAELIAAITKAEKFLVAKAEAEQRREQELAAERERDKPQFLSAEARWMAMFKKRGD